MPGLGALHQHVANLDQHVGGLDQRVGTLEQRVGALDRQVTDNHRVLLESINTNQRLVLEQIHTQMQHSYADATESFESFPPVNTTTRRVCSCSFDRRHN